MVSPRTRSHSGRKGNAVLAIWPANGTLELAERLAGNGSLCVIPGSLDDLGHWIRRASPQHLWDADEVPDPAPLLAEAVSSALDSIVSFDGYNEFLGAGGKVQSIRALRAMLGEGHRPDPKVLEEYVLTKGVRYKGAGRLRNWYEGLLEGRRFNGHDGRPI